MSRQKLGVDQVSFLSLADCRRLSSRLIPWQNKGHMIKLLPRNQSTWIHLTAVGGKGMGALAVLLTEMGYTVTGSDGPLYPPMDAYIAQSKVHFHPEYRRENLRGDSWGIPKTCPDLVIVGNAISRGHVEAAFVEELLSAGKTQRMSFAEALACFAIDGNRSFVVTGTHGKSTTSSVLAWSFEKLGRAPGFFIGAIPENFQNPCRLSSGGVFVSEGDEYDTAYWDKVSKFLHYLPDWVICTGVEFDHADIFPSLKEIEQSFLKLVDKTHQGWVMIEDALAPEPSVTKALDAALRKKGIASIRYGLSSQSEFCVSSWKSLSLKGLHGRLGTQFEMVHHGHRRTFLSSMIGRHNVLNAASCIAALVASGEFGFGALPETLFADYLGIAKRQQELFYSEQSVLIDDFAHHPRAISETLAALKLRYPGRTVRAFFEPRSATSARNILFEDFVRCFDDANEVYLVEATKQNVPMEQRLHVDDLKKKVEARGPKVVVASDFTSLVDSFLSRKKTGPELIVLMSNGSFGGISKPIQESLH